MSPEAQKLYREHLIKLTTERALNQHVAKASGNTLNQNLSGVKAQLMERYLRIADTGDFYQMSDRRFDQITHELIINAPLIIASGLAMSAMRAALSRGAVAAAESGALGEGLVVARIANGARKVVLAESAGFGSKALYAGGRLGGLLAGAATFDLAHTGMQEPEQIDELLEQLYDHTFGTPKEKQYLRDLPAWGKSILWTAATVGAFEFTGKVTNEFVDALLKGSKLFPEKSIQLAVAKLVANGHTETATMLVMGGLQHFVAKDGDMSEFDTIENLIHALISVGALKIVGGAPKVVIATVRGLRGKEPEGPEGPGEAPKKEIEEVKVAERAPEKAKAEPATAERVSLEEALEKGGEVTVSKPEDLMGTLDRLDGEGYKLEPSEGGAVAKKPGKPDIILKESGELARQSKEAERLMNSVRENPTPENMEAAESGLIRLFGAPRSLARLMIAMAAGLIPETAFAGGKGIFETGLLGTFFRFFLGDVSNYAVDKGLDSLAGITMGLLSSKLFWMIVFYRSLRRYPTAKAKKGAQDLYDNQLDTAVTPQTVPSFEAAIAPLKRALKIIKKHILWEPLMNRIRSETPKEIVALAQEKLALVEQLISDYNTALKKGEDVSPIATKMRTALTDLGNAIDSIPIGILGHVFGLVGGRVDLGGVGRGVGNLASGALNQVARHRLLAVLLAAAAALGVGGYKFRHELGWKDKVTHIGPSGEIEVIGPTNIKIDYIYVGQGRNMPDLKVKVKPKFKTINEGESNEAYIYESLDGKKYIIYKSGDGSGVPYNR